MMKIGNFNPLIRLKMLHRYISALLFLAAITFLPAQRTGKESVAIAGQQTLKSGAFIDINSAADPQAAYSIDQLIKEVLVSGGGNCTANVTNVQVSPNLQPSNNSRSWGYFNRRTTGFPFESGVVLVTGSASNAANTFIPTVLSGALPSSQDVDLAAAINMNLSEMYDATYIQFDFVPVTDQLKFEYLFASEEYEGNNSCTYGDGFALLIKKVGDPTYTNLAVLPNNAGPVSVTNIHPYINASCPAVNVQYFAGMNNPPVQTNLAGRTVPLTATATVIPGQIYRFKIVLADNKDDKYDSAVFLKAGSFNIGVEIKDPTGAVIPKNTTLCTGQSLVLNAATAVPGATYQWSLNGTPISGATSSTYTVSHAGTYSVAVLVPGSTCPGTAQTTVTMVTTPVVQNATLTQCAPAATTLFDLTSAQPNISTTPGVIFQYYATLADAQAGNSNTIAAPTAYSSGNAKVYVRVSNGNCYQIAELNLVVNINPAAPVISASSSVLCNNGSVVLTSNYPNGNVWSTGATTQSITVNTPGTYTLTNNAGACPGSPSSITIAAATDPALSITGNTVLCPNSSTVLTATTAMPGVTFVWNTGATGTSLSVTAPGTYTVTATTSEGCTYTKSVVVTADTVPNLQISGNLSFCAGATTTLTASGTGIQSYQWSNGTLGPTLTVSTPGTYTVTGISSGGCSYTSTVTVVQNPVPVAQASSLSVCSAGTTATFNLTSAQASISTQSGVTFAFYADLADATAGNANTIINPASYNSPTATVYVLVSNGLCKVVVPLQLNVVPELNPTITSSAQAICGNTPVTLQSNYATGNLWSTGATTSSITVSTPGTYTLTVSSPTCGTKSTTINVVKDADPNLQISGPATFCEGSTAILTVSSNAQVISYQWSNGTTGATTSISTAGTYTVTATTEHGCTFTKSITVNTTPTPIVNIAAPPVINCTNSTVQINASASIVQQGATILWTASNGGNITSGANTLTPTVNQPGTYTVTITNPGANQCSSSGSVTVIKDITPPTTTINTATTTICAGGTAVLTAGGAATYNWGNGLTGNGNTQTVSPTTTTTYTVTGVGSNGCVGNTVSLTINVVPAIISPIHDVQFCKGESVILDAGSGPNYTYQWSTGATTQTITINEAGPYAVTISNGVCSKTFTIAATYTPVPVIKDIRYENNALTITTDQPAGTPLEYSVDGGITWQASNVFNNVLGNATYQILVRVANKNCYSTTPYYTYQVINAITPNDDGHNDALDLTAVSMYENFGGAIYDRYGKELFVFTPNTPIWKGYYLSNKVKTGTYWYVLHWLDPYSKKPIERSGWILVKNVE